MRKTEKRFFYHSFPRRSDKSGPTAIRQGLSILKAIRDFGLLLTPEAVEWPTSGGAKKGGFTIRHQRRACFTELSRAELPGHAETFGYFALEFDYETMRALGAMPVTYVPNRDVDAPEDGGSPYGASKFGLILATALMSGLPVLGLVAGLENRGVPVGGELHSLNKILIDAQESSNLRFGTESLTGLDDTAVGSLDALVGVLDIVLDMFYPTDNLHAKSKDKVDLAYYRQREWRLVGRQEYEGGGVAELSPEAVERVMAIDPEFFGKRVSEKFDCTRAEYSLVHGGINNQSILHLVSRIFVPEQALKTARKIVREIPGVVVKVLPTQTRRVRRRRRSKKIRT